MKHLILALILALSSQSVFSVGSVPTGYIVPKGTSVRVNAHGVCKKVINGHAVNHYFVPTRAEDEWAKFVDGIPSGVTLDDCDGTYRSCLDYLHGNPGASDGKYTIDPDGDGTGTDPFEVHCDMTTDGGGWTLVWSNTRGGSNKPFTGLSWKNAATLPAVCSQAGTADFGCNLVMDDNRELFNFFIGLDWWQRFTGSQKRSEMMYLWSSDYGRPIEQGGKFAFERFLSSSLYKLKTTNYTQLFGTEVPGFYSYHGASEIPFTTYDLENDLWEPYNCGSRYSETPFWYKSCWEGNLNGGGENLGDGYFNGAYYISSNQQWGTPSGHGAGNGWLYVREHDYLSNCTEIKSKVPQAPSGLYLIDPDGPSGNSPILAKCDMTTDGGGWTLLYNHNNSNGEYFASEGEVANFNVNDPNNVKYSILSRLESFRSLKGNFTFKINAPGYVPRNIWSQRTNPYINQAVAGYVPIAVDLNTDGWGGLERNCAMGDCGASYMDGSVGSITNWFAIAIYADWTGNGGHGTPYSSAINSAQGVPHIQLWTRDDSFLIGEPRDCQDILEYGLSNGDGLYWVDPTQSGSSQQVYCDMTSDGGGWTLLFNHNIIGGYYSDSNDALSKNAATPTADHYSILNQIDDFKANNRYIFKINWPGYVYKNIWAQTSNPTIDQPVAGYQPIAITTTGMNWGGLERNCSTPGVGCPVLMDGSVGVGDWWYAIGSTSSYYGGIPATPDIGGNSYGVPQTQLWTRRAEGNFTKRSCKEILDAGLSTGSGAYIIDPDGVGGEPGLRVYCDMTSDGGGWTRVAWNSGASNSTTIPNDFFVNQYRRDILGFTTVLNNASSINVEKFSRLVNTQEAMLQAPAYPGHPYIDNSTGNWQYDTPRCTGILRHTSRTAGCAGSANDNYDGPDRFNIAVENGNQGIVPAWANSGNELCYSGKGSCHFEFFLR